jgi:hypothetical protein
MGWLSFQVGSMRPGAPVLRCTTVAEHPDPTAREGGHCSQYAALTSLPIGVLARGASDSEAIIRPARTQIAQASAAAASLLAERIVVPSIQPSLMVL